MLRTSNDWTRRFELLGPGRPRTVEILGLLATMLLVACRTINAQPTEAGNTAKNSHVFLELGSSDYSHAIAALKEAESATYVQLRHPGDREWFGEPFRGEIPPSVMKRLSELPLLRELSVWSGRWSEETASLLGKCSSLKSLHLGASQLGERHFERIAELQSLEEISFRSDFSPCCFITLAKLPNLRRIRVAAYGDHFPHHHLDLETIAAIASMDGRLEEFSAHGVSDDEIGLWMGPGVAREIFKVSSLRVLRIEIILCGLTLEDFHPLQSFYELTEFHVGWGPSSSGDEAEISSLLEGVSEKVQARTSPPVTGPPKPLPAAGSSAGE